MTPFRNRQNAFINRMAQERREAGGVSREVEPQSSNLRPQASSLFKPIPFGKRPKKLPVVLSDQDASRLIQCTQHLKHRTVLLVLYAAGLRLAEATHLKVADIDGQRAQIRVRCGKGSKERLVPASPRLLAALREYWKVRRPANYGPVNISVSAA